MVQMRRVLVEKEVAEKMVEVEKAKVVEDCRAQVKRREEEYEVKLEEVRADRSRSQVEVRGGRRRWMRRRWMVVDEEEGEVDEEE